MNVATLLSSSTARWSLPRRALALPGFVGIWPPLTAGTHEHLELPAQTLSMALWDFHATIRYHSSTDNAGGAAESAFSVGCRRCCGVAQATGAAGRSARLPILTTETTWRTSEHP